MAAKTPDTGEYTRTPQAPRSTATAKLDPGPTIRRSLKALQLPASSSSATTALTAFAFQCLAVIAEYIDRTAGGGKPVVGELRNQAVRELHSAIFDTQQANFDEREFYLKAAAAVRGWFVTRLEQLSNAASSSTPARTPTKTPTVREKEPVKTRLALWYQFHCHAGVLPPNLLAVHDLMYYVRRPLDEAARILGRTEHSVAQDIDAAMTALRPLFDGARGKR